MGGSAPYLDDGDVRLILGDCVEVMAGLEAESVDAVVTDPPYGLEFMGKEWDRFDGAADDACDYCRGDGQVLADGDEWVLCPVCEDGGAKTGGYQEKARFNDGGGLGGYRRRPNFYVAGRGFQTWCYLWSREALRVLRPGGHLLAFGGTRTFHRLTCAIEDAGFEVRDCLSWLYGSGFPKSYNVAQSIEKRLTTGKDRRPDRDLGGLSRHRFSGDVEGGLIADTGGPVAITTPEAAAWQGWGTALKPAWEPIVVARKPLAGTVAANVLAHGTGALNVDGCRVGTGERFNPPTRKGGTPALGSFANCDGEGSTVNGRWPANVVLSHTPECREVGTRKVKGHAGYPNGPGGNRDRTVPIAAEDPEYAATPQAGYADPDGTETVAAWECSPDCPVRRLDEEVGEEVSRFFYSPKASTQERDGATHPTVKSLALMRWLVRLVTPPGGLVLDPFAGSGTTGLACREEGFRALLIEREPEYAAMAAHRLRQLSLLAP